MRSPRVRRPTSPCSTTSGRRSSPPPGFLHPARRPRPAMGPPRARRRLPRLARRRRPLRRADVRGLGVRRDGRVVVQQTQDLRPSASTRRPRGPSCSAPPEPLQATQPGSAAGAPGRYGRRRDDVLLPHRVPRLQRRQRARGRRHRHRLGRHAPKRCASCAGSSPTGCLPAAAVGYEWDRPIHLLADGQAAMSVGGTYEAETLAVRTGAGPARRVGPLRLRPDPRRTQRPAGQRRRGDDLRRVPPGGASQGGDAADRARRGARGARRSSPPHRAGPVAALGDRARRRRPALPLARRGDHRTCRDPAVAPARTRGSRRSCRRCSRRCSPAAPDLSPPPSTRRR